MKQLALYVTLSLLAAAGCGTQTDSLGTTDAAPTCTPSCQDRQCGPDGCDGSCGTCETGWTCNEGKGSCECPAESDEAFCTRMNVVCGQATGKDACGRDRQVACDRCASGKQCDQASSTCTCPETDAQLCTRLGKDCGALADAVDSCGDTRAVASCGTCSAGELCGAANTCEVCTPQLDADFCAANGKQCGTFTAQDPCSAQSRTPTCPECQPGFECDAANQCEACSPETKEAFCQRLGKNCGSVTAPDRCGLQQTFDCGTCTGTDTCDDANHCQPCVPESDQALCASNNKECGPLATTDHCNNHRAIAECGLCTGPLEHCDSTGTCAVCLPESDSELCAFYYKNCGSPQLRDQCGQPRTPTCGTTCPSGLTCQTNAVCGNGTAPTNDTCTSPERLVLDASGTATSSGDLTSGTPDYRGSCGGSGNDVVYILTLTQRSNLAVTVTAGNSTIWTEVYIRTSCTSTVDIVCGYGSTQGSNANVNAHGLTPGDYYIILDGYYGNNGPFTLTVTATAMPPPPVNDTCAAPEQLVFVGDTATAVGDTTNAFDNYADACGTGPLNGSDLVYKMTLTADSAVTVKVTPGATATNYYPAVEILSSCPSTGTNLACATNGNGIAQAGKGVLLAGDYYIIVDGTSNSYGPFTLEVTTATPVYNDLCARATDVPLVAVGGSNDLVGTVAGDTSVASDDYTSSCRNSSTGQDLVYRFTTTAEHSVRLDLVSTVEPTLYLRTGCQPNGVEKGCVYSSQGGATVSLPVHRLPAGTYYVFVDGSYSFSNGPFSLTVTASAPPPAVVNDSCAHPAGLTLTNGWAHLEETTWPAGDDFVGSCATSDHPFSGGDVTYTVTAPSFGYLAAKVHRKANSPDYEPAVYIQSACGDPTTDMACGYDTMTAGWAEAITPALAAGTYFIVVDGVGGTFGDFTLDVLFYTSAGPDSCSGAKLLSFDLNGDATGIGDSCQLSNDSTNNVANTCPWANSGWGNDAVYKLVTTATKNLKVAFEPGQDASSYVYIQTTCGAPSTQISCNQATNSVTNVLPMKNLAAGTYYIWLDSDFSGHCGPYDVHFHLSDPPPAPANDACTGAQVIAINAVTGVGTITGTTESATDDTAGSCNTSSAGGPEVFFSFTLPGTRTVDIKVTPDANSDLRPVIYARTACGSAASENQCTVINGTGQTAELQWPRLDQGTYYLVVDSYDRNSTGPFTVTITTNPVGPAAANDVCATAFAMPAIDPTTGKTLVTGDTVDGNNGETSYCANSSTAFTGADLVYTFVLPTDSLVTAKLTRQAGNTAYKPAVSIRRTCALSGEVACGNDSPTSPAGIAQVTKALAAGTWYVVVDGLDSSFGPFELEVSKGTAAAAGDTCGNPIALAFTGDTATANGDLLAGVLTDDFVPTTCESTYAQSADQVYTFTTTTEKFATVSIGPGVTGGELINPFIYLRTACNDSNSEIACAHTNTNGGSTSFTSTRLPPGTYYLIADASSSYYSGTYVLTVTLVDALNPAPANDSCSSATSVVLTNNVAHYSGDTSNANDNYGGTGTCGASNNTVGRLSGGDVVYSVTVTAGSTITAVVTPDVNTRSYVPAVYLRSNCTSAAPIDQLACDYQISTGYRMAGASATNLAAGTYYIIVDGKGGTSGLFALDVYVRPTAVGNTSCSAAEPIAFDTSVPGQATATIVGDTNLGRSNTEGIQHGPQYCYSSGKELYYRFTTTGVQDMVVLTTPLNGTYGPVVYLRSDCADPASQVTCDFNYGGSILNVTALKMPAGAYTLVVDSPWVGASGPFSLQITLSDPPPPPANDSCRFATALTLPASGGTALTFSGSTAPAANDYVGGCQTASNPFDGPDVVYRFTPTTNTQVTAMVVATSSSRLKAAIYLRSTCATTSNDVCNYNPAAGSSNGATVVASVKSGTTYYLIVDGIAGTAGDFDLTLSVDDTKYLDGDECTNPISLDALFAPNPTNPAQMIATVNGDTTTATNGSDGACNGSTGGDFVYAFTLAQESVVGVTVGPNGAASTYAPEFYIRTSCGDPATEIYCAYNSSSTTKSANLTRLPPGLYYLFVDSYSMGSLGPFTLAVTVKPPPVPSALNDTCAGARLLNFTTGTGTSQVATLGSEDSTWASDDAQGSCYQSHGGDLVYTFTTTSAKSFTAVVTPGSDQTLFKPVVYLRNVCNQSADTAERGCTKQTTGGSAATLTINSIPGGTYWLYVDNFLSNQWDQPGGQYSLAVTLDAVGTPAPPANDNCSGARQITLTGQAPSVTTLTGQTTLGATADGFGSGGSCSSDSGTTGADVVYYFDLTSPAKVEAKASFTTTGVSPMPAPVVYIRTNCGSGTVACNYTDSASTVTATAAYLPAGRYYLWVDGSNATGSDFKLDLTLSTPTGTTPPSNFLCSGTLPALTKGVPVTGTTIGSQNTNAVLSAACASEWAAGPNAVYTYTPTQDEFFVVTMYCNTLAPNSWDLLVWMSDRCLDGQSCLAFNNSGSGAGIADSFRYYGKAGVTYYIVVDASSSGNAGTFTLTVN